MQSDHNPYNEHGAHFTMACMVVRRPHHIDFVYALQSDYPTVIKFAEWGEGDDVPVAIQTLCLKLVHECLSKVEERVLREIYKAWMEGQRNFEESAVQVNRVPAAA